MNEKPINIEIFEVKNESNRFIGIEIKVNDNEYYVDSSFHEYGLRIGEIIPSFEIDSSELEKLHYNKVFEYLIFDTKDKEIISAKEDELKIKFDTKKIFVSDESGCLDELSISEIVKDIAYLKKEIEEIKAFNAWFYKT